MRHRVWLTGVILASIVTLTWALQAGGKLFVNGNLASSGVIERNGVTYVPIKDVAKALNLTVAKTSRGWEISQSGGATAVEGVNGKIGDVLWNGYFRFQVVKVIRGKEYTNQFSGDNQKVTPYPEDNDLVIAICRIKNGLKEKVTVFLPAGEVTGLTDDKERSIAPRNGLSIDCPTRGAELLPGAAVDFALTFDVPHDAKLKDLVYQVYSTGPQASGEKKFRVAMANAGS
ncbi:MAG: hypothetical protein BGO01_04085 [Armatimonadetes bacterium 55-13]|nr:hypothetical protein [Armatimonadota bacterium]OJU63330.1 MAG: hypothetical protein BGO01_04085 [Armatimonadetes bacterium 55-13]